MSSPMSSAIIEHADGLPRPQRNWAIRTIALGIVMSVMDGAIANVALPTIAKDLNASPAFSIWIVNGYQLAITISLLPLASFGEIIGYRRVYLAGLLLFTLASLLCALAHTLDAAVFLEQRENPRKRDLFIVAIAQDRFHQSALVGRGALDTVAQHLEPVRDAERVAPQLLEIAALDLDGPLFRR